MFDLKKYNPKAIYAVQAITADSAVDYTKKEKTSRACQWLPKKKSTILKFVQILDKEKITLECEVDTGEWHYFDCDLICSTKSDYDLYYREKLESVFDAMNTLDSENCYLRKVWNIRYKVEEL